MLDKKNLIDLGRVIINAKPSAPTAYSWGEDKFTYSELHETFRKELSEYCATPALYRENKNLIFSLVEVLIDEKLPQRVIEAYNMFAEVRQFKQGEKAIFTQRVTEASRRRAKKFITKVGLAGVYEVFKLDGRSFELETTAYGGAAQISIEEFLDGRLDFNELTNIVMEGMDDAIYVEIVKALTDLLGKLPAANKVESGGFDEPEMDRLLSIADAYGKATIYCTYEFATTMIPAEGWISDEHRNERWRTGYLANYKGHTVIVLPQSYEDETNCVKVIDPQFAYIIPTGTEKPVKIAFEGSTLVDEWKNHDWSKEIRVYKKFGVGVIASNGMCIFQNTELKKDISIRG